MTGLSHEGSLLAALQQLAAPRILVLGDVLLDRYTWGTAERISPEAPVLVLRRERQEHRAGGAANVAAQLAAFGAQPTICGACGSDEAGRQLAGLLEDQGVTTTGLVLDPDRPTTLKDRFLGQAAGGQPNQILRVDHETRNPVPSTIERRLESALDAILPDQDAVLISDYGKGVCTDQVMEHVRQRARRRGLPVLVDPARGRDPAAYRGSTLLKPNRYEAELLTGMRIDSPNAARTAGTSLCQQLDLQGCVITLDRDGMIWVGRDGSSFLHASRPREVYDITGAGDTVLATLGIGFAAGWSPEVAVPLANLAGGLSVERPGIAVITRDDVDERLRAMQAGPAAKCLTLEQATRLVARRRNEGERIVLTNGCFDLLHVGHATYLEEAAALGDALIVAVNSDQSVRRLKGPNRPVIPERERAAMLAALSCVDAVVIFDDETPHRLLETLRPDVLVKGGTYAPHEVVGREVVEGYGGTVHVTGAIDGVSTSRIVDSIRHRQPTDKGSPPPWRAAG